MENNLSVRNSLLAILRSNGRYTSAKELSYRSSIPLYSIYKHVPEGILALNTKLGYHRGSKHTYDSLVLKITQYIVSMNRYCSAYNVASGINISRSTFKDMGINISECNRVAGYTIQNTLSMPRLAGSNKLSEECIKSRIQSIVKEIQVVGTRTTIKHLCFKLGPINWKSLGVNIKDVHAIAKVPYTGAPKIGSISELIEKVSKIIMSNGVYTPTRVISDVLGISPSILSYYNIDIMEMNANLGYVKDNGYFEHSVKKCLEDIYPSHVICRQKSFNNCLSFKGRPLLFDFYIEAINTLIEADGPCHYDTRHPWYSEKVVERDLLKNRFAMDNGILLIRIPYVSKVTREYVVNLISGNPLETIELQHG